MITAEKKEEWLLHLELWKESGLSSNRYCIENNINKNSFRYWIDRDRGKIKVKKSFVKLNVQESLSVTSNNSISLKYGFYEIQIPTASKDSSSIFIELDSEVKEVSQALTEISSTTVELSSGGKQIIEDMMLLISVSSNVQEAAISMSENANSVLI